MIAVGYERKYICIYTHTEREKLQTKVLFNYASIMHPNIIIFIKIKMKNLKCGILSSSKQEIQNYLF